FFVMFRVFRGRIPQMDYWMRKRGSFDSLRLCAQNKIDSYVQSHKAYYHTNEEEPPQIAHSPGDLLKTMTTQ
ncbi:MAG: hypothetical protein LBQ50_07430, partial [Planctomycetaceae bacterium]|nr:hypothetical protein [Planctomycetaceae bacterium]